MGTIERHLSIVSLGLETSLWREILHWAPELEAVKVDVRDFLPAPPRRYRPRGDHRAPAVVAEIVHAPQFLLAKAAVETVLHTSSMVLVGCKSGRHRAPVVAKHAGPPALRIHAQEAQLSAFDLLIVASAFGALTQPAAPLLHAVARAWGTRPRPALVLGWQWEGWADDTEESRGDMPVWPAGMPVRVQMHLHATDGVVWSVASSEWMEPEHVSRQIHVSWVLPQKVLQRCAYY